MSGGLWFLLALALFLSAQAGADVRAPIAAPVQTASPATIDTALYAQGKQVYLTQYCGVCHALAAAGTGGAFGPAHDGIGANADARIADARYKGNATTATEYIRESIVAPNVFIAAGAGPGHQAMPSFTHLPAADIDALVYFLSQQR